MEYSVDFKKKRVDHKVWTEKINNSKTTKQYIKHDLFLCLYRHKSKYVHVYTHTLVYVYEKKLRRNMNQLTETPHFLHYCI